MIAPKKKPVDKPEENITDLDLDNIDDNDDWADMPGPAWEEDEDEDDL